MSEQCCPEVYYCPTSGETECPRHGGFDVCCDRPDLHREPTTRVDFYLAEDPKEGRVTIDGQETLTPVMMQSRYDGPSLLRLNGKPHLGPWEFHLHRLDGTVQKWTSQEQSLEVAR